MKVLLISANTEQINMPVMPFGMACVKQAVAQAGHAVCTLNLMTPEDAQSTIAGAIRDFSPDVIGISVRNIDDQAMTGPRFLLERVKPVVDDCRKHSTAPVVLGGAGYSIFPQSALRYLGADMGIQGEGEGAFVTLLEALQSGSRPSGIPGLFFADNRAAAPAEPSTDLDRYPLPLPDADLMTHSRIDPDQVWLPFQTRRGCAMDCSYCSTAAIEGRRLRKRSPGLVVEALSRFAAAGYRQFFFSDNTFNMPSSYAKTLCDAIVRARLNIRWQAILYPHHVDAELVEKMAGAGCVQVSLGVESGSAEVLRCMNKRYSPESAQHISDLIRDRGIRRMGFVLLGGPGETRESAERSLAFTEGLAMEMVRMTVGIRIYPHTALERLARSQGIIAPGDDLLYPRFYLEPELKTWLPERAASWLATHPGWIM